MRALRGAGWIGACVLLTGHAATANAAWCNVFQVTCFHCRHREPAAVSYYVPAAPAPACPTTACYEPCPQVCTTRYVQRCYYQPVVSYQTRSYYEPVTSYRTSYYYEPVTSYRYSCYYDPCTCSYKQVACPTTSYQLRSQTCAVQSWVQRCTTVPVTSYQQSYYWEPVTSCSTPAPACPTGDCASAPATLPPTQPPPTVGEMRPPGGAGVTENPNRNSDTLPYNRPYPSPEPPPASGSSYRQVPPRSAVPQRQALPQPPVPGVHLDRIVLAPVGEVQGQVIGPDRLPSAGTQLLFVSAEHSIRRQTAAADRRGHYHVVLGSGGWLVYVQGADGRPIFQRRIELLDQETHIIDLVAS